MSWKKKLELLRGPPAKPDEEIILYEMANITHLTVDIIQLIIVFKMKNT